MSNEINTQLECMYEEDCGATCLEMLGYTMPQDKESRDWRLSSDDFPDDFVEVYERITPKKHPLYRMIQIVLLPITVPFFVVYLIARKCKRAYNRFFFRYLHVKVPDFESLSDKPIMFNGTMETEVGTVDHWCIYYKGVVYDPLGQQLTVEEFTERGVHAVYYCYELKTWPNINTKFKLQPYWLEEE